MAESDVSRSYLSNAIDRLAELRREYLEEEARVTATATDWDAEVKSIKLSSILHQLRLILRWYLPDSRGVLIKFARAGNKWMPYHTSIQFDREWLAGDRSRMSDVKTIWIQHPAEFLELCRAGAEDTGTVEEQDERYNKLKEEVEALIGQFKTILVSEEFL